MKISLSCLVALSAASSASAWTAKPQTQRSGALKAATDGDNERKTQLEAHLTDDLPCWANMMDDDCSMGSIYASSFVAKDWIKSLPCAAGVEDCDMPVDLGIPGMGNASPMASVDVADFLSIKRVKSLE